MNSFHAYFANTVSGGGGGGGAAPLFSFSEPGGLQIISGDAEGFFGTAQYQPGVAVGQASIALGFEFTASRLTINPWFNDATGGQTSFTVYRNGIATALTGNVAGGSTAAATFTGAEAFTATDLLAVSANPGAMTGGLGIGASMVLS